MSEEMELQYLQRRHASNADRKDRRNSDVQVCLSADQQLIEGVTRIELK